VTTVTSQGTQRVKPSIYLKRTLSGPRCLITGHWLVQFAVTLLFMFSQGLNTPHGPVALEFTPERMAKIFGPGDGGSYLKAALSLVATGRNTPEWAWVLNLWPPGMVWLDAGIIRFSPLDFGVTIGLITALVWSVTLAVLTWPFMRKVKWAVVVLLAEFALLGSSPFQSWMFDKGLFHADGLAAGLFLLGLALIVNRLHSPAPVQMWIRDGIYVGIAFAATIYLRSAYQLVPWALAGLAVAIAGMIVVRRIRGLSDGDLGRQAILLISAALTVPLLMQPYTAFVQQDRGRTQFVMTQDLFYAGVWQSHNAYPQWKLDGGPTVGCDIDPGECALIHRAQSEGKVFSPAELRGALIKAIVTHPLQFLGNRVAYVTEQWFAEGIWSYPGEGLLFFALLMTTIVAASMRAARGRWAFLVIPVMALALLAPFAFVHVEVRYLIPLKLIGLLAPILVLRPGEPRLRSPQSGGESLMPSGPPVRG
jgi:hypothetical protein